MRRILTLGVLILGVGTIQAASGRYWLRYGGTCASAKQYETAKALVDRAARAGMNGMTIGGIDNLWRWKPDQQNRLRALKAHAEKKGIALIPHGWSVGYGTMFSVYPDLVETMPVTNMPFVCKGGRIVSATDGTAFVNGDLSDFDLAKNKFAGWWNDQPGTVSFVDTNVTYNGKASVRFEPQPADSKHSHARFYQHVTLQPGRCYRFSAWVRGVNVHHINQPVRAQVYLDKVTGGGVEQYAKGCAIAKGDDTWRQVAVDFFSGAATGAKLYIGSWQLKEGTFWIADLKLEEVGLKGLSKRASAKRTLRNAKTGQVYVEGRDWVLAKTKADEEVYMTVPTRSRISAGARLLFDGYVIARSGPKMQWSACMSDPRLYDCFRKSAQAVEEILHPVAWLLSVDEVRNGGTCELCAARKTDMAHIYGECLTKMNAIIRKASPQAEVLAWSDMMDPWLNAKEQYCGCRGSWVGVADYIPKNVDMMFWSSKSLKDAVPYFTQRGHKFMGSVCCDTKDVRAFIQKWKDALTPYAGLKGFMYTTWVNNYEHIETFMEAVK